MASIIDNRKKTMLDSLKNSLQQAERVDILTAFFYFSGFDALAEDLKDKNIRILVGNTIDPDAIDDLCRAVKDCSMKFWTHMQFEDIAGKIIQKKEFIYR